MKIDMKNDISLSFLNIENYLAGKSANDKHCTGNKKEVFKSNVFSYDILLILAEKIKHLDTCV